MTQPVIFLAFANNESSPLESLRQESDQIYGLLTQGANEQYYQLHADAFCTIEKVSSYLSSYKDRVSIFHYAGHAGGSQLLLADQEANAGGIAHMLAQQKTLQLVFLNGCSTRGQVALLLKLGIPVVIATSVPINDTKAGQFAKQFYEALCNQSTIEEAFQQAAAYVQTLDGSEIQIHRGFDLEDPESDQLPWGLYTAEGAEEALRWKLPTKSHKEIIIRGATDRYNTSRTPVNDHLTQVLFEVLADYNDELEFMQMQAAKGKKADIRRVRLAIMNCLPAPIGEQVRRLFAADPETMESGLDRISQDRLNQLIKTYSTIMQVLAISLLSQLWDFKHTNSEIALSEDCRNNLTAFFKISAEQMEHYDYVPLIRSIRLFFDAQKIPYFIEELEELRKKFEAEETLYTAIQFMEQMKTELHSGNGQIAANEIESFCVQAEEQLAEVFRQSSFIAKYKLATIKNIDLIKRRHEKPRYRHFLVNLDTVTAGYLDQDETFDQFADNQSVLFLRSEENMSEYLNLSPFIIDENAFTGNDKSKLYFFSHYQSEADAYHYDFAYVKGDSLTVNRHNFPEIAEQFDNFAKAVLGKKLNEL